MIFYFSEFKLQVHEDFLIAYLGFQRLMLMGNTLSVVVAKQNKLKIISITVMNYSQDYSLDALRSKPKTLFIEEWRLEYLAFCKHENEQKTPLVFLSGAFQNFSSYYNIAKKGLEEFPVILLDLPSQGSNNQLCPELDLVGLSGLVQQFVSHLKLSPINLIGVSFGSLIAALYTHFYPGNVNKLMLTGITTRARPALAEKLKYGIELIQTGRQSEFAAGTLFNLVNFSSLDEIELSNAQIKLLHRQFNRLSDAALRRFIQNSERLMVDYTIPGFPSVPVLVATGEYDHFTTPFENVLFARSCPYSTMALIKRADHLILFEQREAVISLLFNFMMGEKMETNNQYLIIPREDYISFSRRNEPRYSSIKNNASVAFDNGSHIPVNVIDLNFSGCRLVLHDEFSLLHAGYDIEKKKLHLHILGVGGSFAFQILKQEGHSLRGQFFHTDLKNSLAFRNFIAKEIKVDPIVKTIFSKNKENCLNQTPALAEAVQP